MTEFCLIDLPEPRPDSLLSVLIQNSLAKRSDFQCAKVLCESRLHHTKVMLRQ